MKGNLQRELHMKNTSPLINGDKERFLLELYRNALVLEEKELYDYFLDHAVELTKSKIGFFHFVTSDQKTIILTTWNKNALKNCTARYDNHYSIEKAGNWADCVRFKHPIIYNDFELSPNQKGLPEGHVNIKRFLSVPILENGNVKIIFGVGNKNAPYNEDDIIQLELVANDFNKILKQRRAEKKLRESQVKYYSLFANMTEGFFLGKILVDEKGNPIDFIFLEVNNGFEKQSGLSCEDVVGKMAKQALPAIEQRWIQKYGNVALTGQPIRFEDYNQDTKKWYEVYSYSPTRGEFAAIFTDITERKKKEGSLQWQNLVIGSAQDAIISTDNSFIIKSWNSSAERLFGWSAKEAIGKSTDILQIEYPTLEGTNREKALELLMKTGFWKEEVVYHRKDGSHFFGSGAVSLVKDKDGKTTGLVAIIHDITPRKLREKKLMEARHDLNHAQRVAKIGSWRLDVNHNVLLWSDENHRIFGIPKGTPMTYQTFLGCIHPEDRDYVDKKWKAALNGKPYAIEHRIIVNGDVKWVWEKADLEFDEEGNIKGGFGTTQEITDFVKLREKLKFYSRHLEELVEEKTKQLKDAERMAAIGETAGMIGHDIRNPLQSMDGALFLAQEYVESIPDGVEEKKELKEIHNMLRNQVSYIDHMIADLQDFAKKAKPKFLEVDLPEILTSALEMVNIPQNIIVTIDLSEEHLKLVADPDDLKRVLSNLIRNSVQAMSAGGELNILTYPKDGKVWICIEDTGVGIAEEFKPNIFTPLFTTKSKGQGFGLAVCKKLIEAHDGEITFQSQEGKGTTFTIKLPIIRCLNW